MTDALGLSITLLNKIVSELRTMKRDHVDALLEDRARLMIIPAGTKITLPEEQHDLKKIEQGLQQARSRDDATALIERLKLTKEGLVGLAGGLKVRVRKSDTKPLIVDTIVDAITGNRLEARAFQRE